MIALFLPFNRRARENGLGNSADAAPTMANVVVATAGFDGTCTQRN